MDVMSGFLRSEINSQELYETILQFVLSPHIRNGEFEGNEYIIKKMDLTNFFVYPEYEYPDGHREIHDVIAVYKNDLIKQINATALARGFQMVNETKA